MKTLFKAGLTFHKKSVIAINSFFFLLFLSLNSVAQDAPTKVDVDINSGTDSVWYGQPWVWVVGVAVFIVIIVAITRGNKNDA